jgi:microcompartment protein CcmK/EutM
VKLCRVLGPVVATAKHPTYLGRKLLVVQPLDESGADVGSSFLAVDDVQAGRGDEVLVMQEGNGVRQLLKLGSQVPIRSLIVGIVDHVEHAGPAGQTGQTGRSA